jgi:uncharacterized MAPEG superfamily protein
MPPELTMLVLSVLLGLLHLILQSVAATLERGSGWNVSARDQVLPPLRGMAGRLERAQRNFLETFAFFAAAVLIAHAVRHHNWMTLVGAHLYFWGRVVYLPLYAFGVPVVRTLVWTVATLGIVLVLLGPFF